MNDRTPSIVSLVVVIGVLATTQGLAQQPGPEEFTATASVKSPTASADVRVTIGIDRFVSDADRDRILAIVKANDAGATRRALEAADDIGYIAIGTRRTPIKFAYARPSADGRIVTVVTARPLLFLGAAAPDSGSRDGFDLALGWLVLDARGTGEGELAPAAKVKLNDAGALVTEDYGRELVRLTGIARVK